MELIETTEMFDFIIICSHFAFQTFVGSLSSVVMKKLFIELISNGRGSLDYARNVAKKFYDPKPDGPSFNSTQLTCCLNFHHADSKQSSHNEEETWQNRCSCCCSIVRGPFCFSTQKRNLQPNFHHFFFGFGCSITL